MNECPVSKRKPEPRIFLSRMPAARKAVPSLTLYDCWGPSASLSFIGACCVVNGSVRVRRMLDPNLGRTCRIEALGNTWICSFSSDCSVNWTQVAPSWSSAEAFSDLLKSFRRGTDGVYLFTTPMQAMASHASGYLAREWIPARSARAFREHASDLRRIFVFFCFSKSGFIKGTMKNWLMLVCFYFL